MELQFLTPYFFHLVIPCYLSIYSKFVFLYPYEKMSKSAKKNELIVKQLKQKAKAW